MSTLWVLAVKMEVHFEPKRHPSSDKRARRLAIALHYCELARCSELELKKGGRS